MSDKRKMTNSDVLGEKDNRLNKMRFKDDGAYKFSDQNIFFPNREKDFNLKLTATDRMEELLKQDNVREADGFPRKIVLGKIRGHKEGEVIVVPATEEDKFYLGPPVNEEDGEGGEGDGEEGDAAGQGDGEEGETIGEIEADKEFGEGDEPGPGDGDGGEHEILKNAYELGKILTEEFELPNLQDKNKKVVSPKVTYELTDRNRKTGHVLNKKRSLIKIVETNIGLGKLTPEHIEPGEFIVAPNDKVYDLLSKEKTYESRAVVFFVRDYSGSMGGKPTEAVIDTHLLIYSWLMYQYKELITTRFILHDTEAKEVSDFDTYYKSSVAGGTIIGPAYELVNKIVEEENLATDYNVFLFHGTDGDDWDSKGEKSIPQIKIMLEYISRIGITVAKNDYMGSREPDFVKYLKASGLLDSTNNLRMDDFFATNNAPNGKMEHIKKLLS